METVKLIVDLVVVLVGIVGGGVGIIFWRENKKLKLAEADYKQAEVKDQLVKVELQEAEAWQKLYEEQKNKSDEKSVRLKALYKQVDEQKDEINACKFRVQQLEWYHCTVNGCTKRRPPHVFDTAGNEVTKEEIL